MTFQITYEELLARNEKLEDTVRDAIKKLDEIESDGYFDLHWYKVEDLREDLEKAL